MRRQATDWGKTIIKDTSDKELLSKMYKELFKFQISKQTNELKKKGGGDKDLNRCLTKDDTQKANTYMKICPTSHVITREEQIKTRHYYTPIRMVKTQNTDNAKF